MWAWGGGGVMRLPPHLSRPPQLSSDAWCGEGAPASQPASQSVSLLASQPASQPASGAPAAVGQSSTRERATQPTPSTSAHTHTPHTLSPCLPPPPGRTASREVFTSDSACALWPGRGRPAAGTGPPEGPPRGEGAWPAAPAAGAGGRRRRWLQAGRGWRRCRRCGAGGVGAGCRRGGAGGVGAGCRRGGAGAGAGAVGGGRWADSGEWGAPGPK